MKRTAVGSVLSQSGNESSSGASRLSKNSTFDPLNPMMEKQRRFYHPHIKQQMTTTQTPYNRAFEIVESFYFCIADLIEGVVSFISRFFFGIFYILV